MRNRYLLLCIGSLKAYVRLSTCEIVDATVRVGRSANEPRALILCAAAYCVCKIHSKYKNYCHILRRNERTAFNFNKINTFPEMWLKRKLEPVKVKLSLCVSNYALPHECVWGSECIDPYFLHLGTSWRWVVSFTPRPLNPRGKSSRYPLDRKLGGPQSQSGRRGEEKILDPTGSRTPTSRSSSL
jgi:hypothetical protein